MIVALRNFVPSGSLNSREHWAAKHRRVKHERTMVRMFLNASRDARPGLPVLVTLTRCSPRLLDDDNAVGSMKGVRDEISAWLRVDDGDPRITFIVKQEKVPTKSRGTLIRIDAA